ncbi:efflux RND transporter periplasmic adaptor subunit [Mangrovimonas sp. AS39]|uniref:efflux RND transporter periplasmic adaptor subunit n=1 Tax=Mangrovimonas futianensis TaxID=2895523 RepID=UPI001E2EBF0F|nr:efflux RND transporter periplasmic adaptor subunit [Mangrovimonas futianensis]MCF1190597.1 efflux RND transporter periplasmic adaptor subunit [Mangrovimonas futianensis]MCF1193651.1 efflux RND transporter periplasmic adaptor subunit [Mangrovimonas futianensis]
MKYLYSLLLLLFVVSCKSNSEEAPVAESNESSHELEITREQFQGESMALGQLSEYHFQETVQVNGMIDVPPHNKSNITTFMGGYVTKTPLLVGDLVKKGQLLVTLENTEYVEIQQQYLEAAEKLTFLKSEYERQKTLFDENITSQKNYLQAESNYKSNLAHYNGLKKKLEMMNLSPKSVEEGHISRSINLYAPISGSVSKVNISNGNYVSPADIVMEIVDTDHIHLELSVFEKDIMKIKKGQTIQFKIPEASNDIYTAEVHLVGTTIDENTRRVQVHGHLNKEEANFIVGMYVEAYISVSQKTAKGLPNEAIIKTENEAYVLTLTETTETAYYFEKTEVPLGETNEQTTEILNPAKLKGKDILIKGTSLLDNEGDSGHGH